MKFLAPVLALLASMVVAQAPSAQNNNYIGSTPSERFVVNATQAYTAIQAAAQESANISVPVCISVVDPAGQLVAFLRLDNSVTVSIDISMKKAKTVILFNGQYGTGQLYPLVQPGGSLYAIEETNGGLIVFGGGLPLYVDDHLIGAIGVSGGSVTQDIQIATAGVRALGGYLSTNQTSTPM